MPDYPIVKIPQRFYQINKSVPSLPSAPVVPLEPVNPIVPSPPNLLVVKEDYSGWVLPILVCFVGMGIISIGNLGRDRPAATGIGLVFILVAYFWPRSSSSKEAEKNNTEKQEVYAKSLKKYNDEKSVFDKERAQYGIDLQKYNSDKQAYDLLLKQRDGDDYEWSVHKFRESLLIKALSEAGKPVNYTGKQYRSGVTEDWFFNKLVGFFSERNYYAPLPISTNGVLIIPQGDFRVRILRQHILPGSVVERPFMPDFILSIASTGQNVVIEIDEPYVGSDGTPIHYIDSKDSYRDKHFLANGWIVIRFTEEQIIKYPSECCWFIVDVLLRNTSSFEMDSIQHEMMSYWDEITLPKVPQWTKEQANRMAFSRYRNTYLPSQLAAKIKEEEYVPSNSSDSEPRTAFNREEREKHDEEMRKLYGDDDNNDLPF